MLSFFKQSVGGLLVAGAAIGRAYQFLFDQESDALRNSRHLSFTTTLLNYQAIRNQPEEANLINVLVPAASIIGSAYFLYNERNQAGNLAVYPRVWPQPEVPAVPVRPFKNRLEVIGFDDEQVPEAFIDPISFEIMENPVKAMTIIRNSEDEPLSTAHFYDKTTYQALNGICPENRQPFVEVQDDEGLKQSIESFVAEKEAAHRANPRLG